MTNPKPFLSVMNETKALAPASIRQQLCQIFDSQPQGHKCPVPDCTNFSVFQSWGSLYDHFMDAGHKQDFYNLYHKKYHRHYGPVNGHEFKFGVMALMLAQIRQPTTLTDAANTAPTRKLKKQQQQQQTLPDPGLEKIKETPSLEPEKGKIEPITPIPPIVQPPRNAFAKVSEIIRNSEEINLNWRGQVLDFYIEMFHGIPPCFHCRNSEGKQIHHQNPLFHEIVLLVLNKLGTTADKVWEAKENGDESLLNSVLKEVVAYHMKNGRVLAVPYCSECNQDAEIKRKLGKKRGSF